jgi:hypothetical protein
VLGKTWELPIISKLVIAVQLGKNIGNGIGFTGVGTVALFVTVNVLSK